MNKVASVLLVCIGILLLALGILTLGLMVATLLVGGSTDGNSIAIVGIFLYLGLGTGSLYLAKKLQKK